jgi:hypothetical protein
MSSHRVRGALAVAGTVVLLVVVTAGCGRRGLPVGAVPDGAAGQAGGPSSVEATAVPTEPAGPAATIVATEPPAATTPPVAEPPPTAEPMTVPDLSAIDQLLADLDAALGADATADTDEGSAP